MSLLDRECRLSIETQRIAIGRSYTPRRSQTLHRLANGPLRGLSDLDGCLRFSEMPGRAHRLLLALITQTVGLNTSLDETSSHYPSEHHQCAIGSPA